MQSNRRKMIRSIAVVILVLSCVFISLLSTLGDYAPKASSTSAQAPTATERPPFHPEAWELTFLDSLRYEDIDDEAPITHVLMGVEIRNVSDASGIPVRNSFTLLDVTGQALGEYHMSPYTPLPPTTVEAGEMIRGDIFFEIPGADLNLENLSLAFQIRSEGTTYDLERPARQPIDLRRLDLREALAEGLLDIEVLGKNLQRIDVRLIPHLEPEIELSYEVTILPGTLFLAPMGSLQDMVVRYGRTVMVRPVLEASLDLAFELEVSVACADMHLDGPEGGEAYTVSMEDPHEDLAMLLSESSFAGQDFRVQQFAIWTITDNPGRNGYVQLGTFGIGGTGPSDEEMELIRQIFTAAGISLDRYHAFQ